MVNEEKAYWAAGENFIHNAVSNHWKKKVPTSQCFHGYHDFVLNIYLEYYSITFAINLVFVFLKRAVNANTQ